MKVKTTGSHKKEISFMIAGSVLAISLISYCLYLVASISKKASTVFGEEVLKGAESQSFDFVKYDNLVRKLYPGSTTVLSSYAQDVQPLETSSSSASTSTITTSSTSR
jgi:hypothetical protein